MNHLRGILAISLRDFQPDKNLSSRRVIKALYKTMIKAHSSVYEAGNFQRYKSFVDEQSVLEGNILWRIFSANASLDMQVQSLTVRLWQLRHEMGDEVTVLSMAMYATDCFRNNSDVQRLYNNPRVTIIDRRKRRWHTVIEKLWQLRLIKSCIHQFEMKTWHGIDSVSWRVTAFNRLHSPTNSSRSHDCMLVSGAPSSVTDVIAVTLKWRGRVLLKVYRWFLIG